jgi:hypothetical protein
MIVEDHSAAAEWIAAGFVALVTLVLLVLARHVAVATKEVEYTPAGGVKRRVSRGSIIPAADTELVIPDDYRTVRLSLLWSLVVGKDNRTSTSKAVAFAWTYAVVFGIVALMVAKWLGTPTGWDALTRHGLQEEYLLLLGGPYAAAVLAKAKAVADSQGDSGKPKAPLQSANMRQLVADDAGDGDLGDFQYVLFNVVALAWFLGTFVPHLQAGFPDVPSLLAGLTLTSAGAYSAKKLVSQAAPLLNGLHPPSAPPSAQTVVSQIEIWGRNLLVPGGASGDDTPVPPTVSIGGRPAPVLSTTQPLGVDHLAVKVPNDAPVGPAKVTVLRADGVAASASNGADWLTLTVTSPGKGQER